MKKMFKRIFTLLVVVVMILTATPLSSFIDLKLIGFDKIFTTKAKAAEYKSVFNDIDLAMFLGRDISGVIEKYGSNYVEESIEGGHYYVYNNLLAFGITENAYAGFESKNVVSISAVTTNVNLYQAFYSNMSYNDLVELVPNIEKPQYFYNELTNEYMYSTTFIYENYLFAYMWKEYLSDDDICYQASVTLYGNGEHRTVVDSGSCGADGDNVTWTFYDDGELVINGKGAMKNFNTQQDYDEYADYDIKKVTIKQGVTKIGDYAFYTCYNLSSIVIPNSVTSIGDLAFCFCDSLKDIYYSGTERDWNNIKIGSWNRSLEENAINFYYNYIYDDESNPKDDITEGRTAHSGTLNNYVKNIDGLNTEVSEVIVDNISYSVSKNTIEYYELERYLNKEVAFVIKNGEVVFITEIPDISERISFAISTDDDVGYSFYGDNKFSTGSVKLKISIYNTLQTHRILPPGKDGDEYKKNLATLKTLDCLNINPIEVQLSSDSTVFNFNGKSSVHIPVNKCLYAGESFETEVVANLNKGTDLGSYETGAGFTGALSCDLNGSNYVKFDDCSVIITNYNLAPYSPSFSGGTGNQSGTTGGSTTNKDQLAKKAANELKKVQKSSSNGAISLAGSPDLIELIGSDRLDAIGAKMLSVMALSTAPEKTFKDINVLSDAVIEKLFGAKKWFQIWNNKVSFDIVVDTDEYGEIKICFTSESPVYNFNGSNLGSLGQINYEITGGKGKKSLEKSGFPMSGFAGAFTTYDLDSFCDAVFSFVLDELKKSYDTAYGNNLDKAADFIFGDSVNRILSYTDFGSVSGVYWELITFPGKSFKIECPVNIYVYDSDDNLVASIENNQVTLSNEDIYIEINGDTKYIKLPNESYKIVYVATSKGNLRVTVNEMANYSTSLRTVVIDEIPLVAGVIYTQDLSGAIVGDADYSLIDYNGIIYDADYDELNYHTHSSNGVYLDCSEATCEEYGLKCSLCTVCKEWYYIQKEKTSHTDTDHDNYCDVCSESIYLAFEDEIKINMPSVTKINFGDTLVLQLEEIEIPEGYAIEWLVEGAGVSTSVSEDGLECRVTSIANGNAVISAKIVSENGEAISNADGEAISDEITLVSKAGFWQKFVSFFKNLFGINRIIY